MGALLAWLIVWGHQMWPATPTSQVWPNIIAAVVCAIPAFLVHHVWTEKRHARLVERIKGHHADQLDAVHAALRSIQARLAGDDPQTELQVVAEAAVEDIEEEAAGGDPAAR